MGRVDFVVTRARGGILEKRASGGMEARREVCGNRSARVEGDERALDRRRELGGELPHLGENSRPGSIQVEEHDEGAQVACGAEGLEGVEARVVGDEQPIEVEGQVAPAREDPARIGGETAREREDRAARPRAECRSDDVVRSAHVPTR